MIKEVTTETTAVTNLIQNNVALTSLKWMVLDIVYMKLE